MKAYHGRSPLLPAHHFLSFSMDVDPTPDPKTIDSTAGRADSTAADAVDKNTGHVALPASSEETE